MYYEIHLSGDSEGLLHSLGALMANPFILVYRKKPQNNQQSLVQ